VIPSKQPFARPTSAPRATIYQTKEILFFPGQSSGSEETASSSSSLPTSDKVVGSSCILFGRNYRHSGKFPAVISLSERRYSEVFVSFLNDSVSGIARGTITRSVAIIGDINNDGFLDQLVGLPLNSTSLVYLGDAFGTENTDTESFKIIGDIDRGGGQLGWASIRIGDLNHDGCDEIVISAPYANTVYFIFGREDFNKDTIYINALLPEQGFKLIGSRQDINFGVAIALLHDFNNDGYQDMAVTGVRPEGENVIYILLGNADFGKEDIYIDQLIVNRPSSYYRIFSPYLSYGGFSIAGIGDVNSDGYNDLAIGSIPITGTHFGEQKTYVVYGREKHPSEKNDLFLSNMTETHGFVVSGGGFLVEATGDVNADGIADVMITTFYEWQGKGNAYLINNPRGVTYSPTNRPSSCPSSFPSSLPSVSPSTSAPSRSPTTSFPTVFAPLTLFPTSSSSVLESILDSTETSSSNSLNFSGSSLTPPNSEPTYRPIMKSPTLKSTLFPSFPPAPFPSALPTLPPSQKVSSLPTFLRRPPSPKPTGTMSPIRNLQVRKTLLPSPIPTTRGTTTTAFLQDTTITEIDCTKAGSYQGRNDANYAFEITANQGTVQLTGSDDIATKNYYLLYCPSDRVDVVIKNFRLSNDLISLIHLSDSGYWYSSLTDIKFFSNSKASPLTLSFCSENKLQVILSTHTSFDLQESNFLFSQPTSISNKRKARNNAVINYADMMVVGAVCLVLLIIYFGLSCGTQEDLKVKEIESQFYCEDDEEKGTEEEVDDDVKMKSLQQHVDTAERSSSRSSSATTTSSYVSASISRKITLPVKHLHGSHVSSSPLLSFELSAGSQSTEYYKISELSDEKSIGTGINELAVIEDTVRHETEFDDGSFPSLSDKSYLSVAFSEDETTENIYPKDFVEHGKADNNNNNLDDNDKNNNNNKNNNNDDNDNSMNSFLIDGMFSGEDFEDTHNYFKQELEDRSDSTSSSGGSGASIDTSISLFEF
jgi:hypothetical protein